MTSQTLICRCEACLCNTDAAAQVMSPTEFESHAGLVARSAWSDTITVDGSDASPETLGTWLSRLGRGCRPDEEIEADRVKLNARLAAGRMDYDLGWVPQASAAMARRQQQQQQQQQQVGVSHVSSHLWRKSPIAVGGSGQYTVDVPAGQAVSRPPSDAPPLEPQRAVQPDLCSFVPHERQSLRRPRSPDLLPQQLSWPRTRRRTATADGGCGSGAVTNANRSQRRGVGDADDDDEEDFLLAASALAMLASGAVKAPAERDVDEAPAQHHVAASQDLRPSPLQESDQVAEFRRLKAAILKLRPVLRRGAISTSGRGASNSGARGGVASQRYGDSYSHASDGGGCSQAGPLQQQAGHPASCLSRQNAAPRSRVNGSAPPADGERPSAAYRAAHGRTSVHVRHGEDHLPPHAAAATASARQSPEELPAHSLAAGSDAPLLSPPSPCRAAADAPLLSPPGICRAAADSSPLLSPLGSYQAAAGSLVKSRSAPMLATQLLPAPSPISQSSLPMPIDDHQAARLSPPGAAPSAEGDLLSTRPTGANATPRPPRRWPGLAGSPSPSSANHGAASRTGVSVPPVDAELLPASATDVGALPVPPAVQEAASGTAISELPTSSPSARLSLASDKAGGTVLGSAHRHSVLTLPVARARARQVNPAAMAALASQTGTQRDGGTDGGTDGLRDGRTDGGTDAQWDRRREGQTDGGADALLTRASSSPLPAADLRRDCVAVATGGKQLSPFGATPTGTPASGVATGSRAALSPSVAPAGAPVGGVRVRRGPRNQWPGMRQRDAAASLEMPPPPPSAVRKDTSPVLNSVTVCLDTPAAATEHPPADAAVQAVATTVRADVGTSPSVAHDDPQHHVAHDDAQHHVAARKSSPPTAGDKAAAAAPAASPLPRPSNPSSGGTAGRTHVPSGDVAAKPATDSSSDVRRATKVVDFASGGASSKAPGSSRPRLPPPAASKKQESVNRAASVPKPPPAAPAPPSAPQPPLSPAHPVLANGPLQSALWALPPPMLAALRLRLLDAAYSNAAQHGLPPPPFHGGTPAPAYPSSSTAVVQPCSGSASPAVRLRGGPRFDTPAERAAAACHPHLLQQPNLPDLPAAMLPGLMFQLLSNALPVPPAAPGRLPVPPAMPLLGVAPFLVPGVPPSAHEPPPLPLAMPVHGAPPVPSPATPLHAEPPLNGVPPYLLPGSAPAPRRPLPLLAAAFSPASLLPAMPLHIVPHAPHVLPLSGLTAVLPSANDLATPNTWAPVTAPQSQQAVAAQQMPGLLRGSTPGGSPGSMAATPSAEALQLLRGERKRSRQPDSTAASPSAADGASVGAAVKPAARSSSKAPQQRSALPLSGSSAAASGGGSGGAAGRPAGLTSLEAPQQRPALQPLTSCAPTDAVVAMLMDIDVHTVHTATVARTSADAAFLVAMDVDGGNFDAVTASEAPADAALCPGPNAADAAVACTAGGDVVAGVTKEYVVHGGTAGVASGGTSGTGTPPVTAVQPLYAGQARGTAGGTGMAEHHNVGAGAVTEAQQHCTPAACAAWQASAEALQQHAEAEGGRLPYGPLVNGDMAVAACVKKAEGRRPVGGGNHTEPRIEVEGGQQPAAAPAAACAAGLSMAGESSMPADGDTVGNHAQACVEAEGNQQPAAAPAVGGAAGKATAASSATADQRSMPAVGSVVSSRHDTAVTHGDDPPAGLACAASALGSLADDGPGVAGSGYGVALAAAAAEEQSARPPSPSAHAPHDGNPLLDGLMCSAELDRLMAVAVLDRPAELVCCVGQLVCRLPDGEPTVHVQLKCHTLPTGAHKQLPANAEPSDVSLLAASHKQLPQPAQPSHLVDGSIRSAAPAPAAATAAAAAAAAAAVVTRHSIQLGGASALANATPQVPSAVDAPVAAATAAATAAAATVNGVVPASAAKGKRSALKRVAPAQGDAASAAITLGPLPETNTAGPDAALHDACSSQAEANGTNSKLGSSSCGKRSKKAASPVAAAGASRDDSIKLGAVTAGVKRNRGPTAAAVVDCGGSGISSIKLGAVTAGVKRFLATVSERREARRVQPGGDRNSGGGDGGGDGSGDGGADSGDRGGGESGDGGVDGGAAAAAQPAVAISIAGGSNGGGDDGRVAVGTHAAARKLVAAV